ncbi:DinB family protein [Nocardioides hungaricus]
MPDMGELTIRNEPPLAGTEVEALLGSLERLRGYLLWKCGGLDAAGIRQTLGPSTLTLGGLLKHLSAVEAITFAWKLHGRRPFPPFDRADWDDEGFHLRVEDDDTPESLERLFQESVAQGRALVAEAIENGGLGGPADVGDDDGNHANVRRLVCDMIEEYGRHVGHADLIRESVDGLVGEDPE